MKALLLLFLSAGIVCGAYAADYAETELTVTAALDGLRMGATLTAPAAPKAAIVLATGSGIQNRDEEIHGKKPFRTIAEFLSANGYAVLRVDDRGFENSADAENATMETFVSDVFSAVALIDSLYPHIPTGIIGHSAGGSYAIRNAMRNQAVDFIVTLAAPAWSGDSVVMSQSRALATVLSGRWDAEPTQRRLLEIAKSPLPDYTARTLLTTALSEAAGEVSQLPDVQQHIQDRIDMLLSPWYRSFLRYDPSGDIAAIRVPFLALNGSKDMQVLPENLITIKKLNPKAETQLMDGMNHLFQISATGLPQEYATLSGDICDTALRTILRWLDENIATASHP